MARAVAKKLQVLAFSDCTALVPVGVYDLLRKSIELSADAGSRRRFELELVAVGRGRAVRAAGGVSIRCDATLSDRSPGDLVVVPALDPDVSATLKKNAAVVPWLRQAHAGGSDVASACTGAFALAEAGLLDGRSATTHWAFQALLAERHPRVRLAPQAFLVDQGRIVTAGGATSFIQLALFLVERWMGPAVARRASQMFLIDPNKAPQGAYAAFSGQKRHGDASILSAQEQMEASPGRSFSLDASARSVGMSRRSFARRFREATGNTPLEYVQRVRVEAAKRALEEGGSVHDAASAAGYADPVAFRKMFCRHAGLAPAEYRARYGPRSAPGWRLGSHSAR